MTYIIAEAGINHNGDMDIVRAMIDAAKQAGADCIKFQLYNTTRLISEPKTQTRARDEIIQKRVNIRGLLKQCELTRANVSAIMDMCAKAEIDFLATPFDCQWADIMMALGCRDFKVGSDRIFDVPLMDLIYQYANTLYVSLGMAQGSDIERLLNNSFTEGVESLVLMHCVSKYPTPPEQANMKKIRQLQTRFGNEVGVGFSDHTTDIYAGSCAVINGATCLEKHFTLDHNMPGPDQKMSFEPDELKTYITMARGVEVYA